MEVLNFYDILRNWWKFGKTSPLPYANNIYEQTFCFPFSTDQTKNYHTIDKLMKMLYNLSNKVRSTTRKL